MEHEKTNTWNLPDDPFERQARVEELADDLCKKYDEIYYEYMNKILEQVRKVGRAAIEETPQ